MPTNDERREMAAKLRGLAVVALRGSDDVVGFIEALDEELFDFGPNLMSDIALRLAEFIEPEERTCYIEHIDEDSFHLSCGHEAAGHVSPSFCPYCGAKVVQQ